MFGCRLTTRLIGVVLPVFLRAVSVSAEWKEKVLYSFQGGMDGGKDGAVPAGGVVLDEAGNLYGATSDGGDGCVTGGCGTVYQLIPQKDGTWKENILHMFSGTDGASPESGLIQDAEGSLYGTTAWGGTGPCVVGGSNVGCGTVYEMVRPSRTGGGWTHKVLYNFQGDKDGQTPIGNLAFDEAGNLYGVTWFGGGYGSCDPFDKYCGTVFRLSPAKYKGDAWREEVLYSLHGVKPGELIGDGAWANGGLVLDQEGVIYGTTKWGGLITYYCPYDPVNDFSGCGTVFELTPPSKQGGLWSKKAIYLFKGRPNDGGGPNGDLILRANGVLYGTTIGGAQYEGGVVFELTPPTAKNGVWNERLIHVFTGGVDGSNPGTGLIAGAHGSFYGTASGGPNFAGLIFRMTPPSWNAGVWTFKTVYDFAGSPDGDGPTGLTDSPAGAVYGTTLYGGTSQNCGNYGCGTVFELSP